MKSKHLLSYFMVILEYVHSILECRWLVWGGGYTAKDSISLKPDNEIMRRLAERWLMVHRGAQRKLGNFSVLIGKPRLLIYSVFKM